MTRTQCRKRKLAKQKASMAEKGYARIRGGSWVRIGSEAWSQCQRARERRLARATA